MDLGLNKIAFCVLATGLILIGLDQGSKAFFPSAEKKHGGGGEEHAEVMGYHIDVPKDGEGGAAVVEGPRDYGVLLASGNLANGKSVAEACTTCHNFAQGGAAMQGPPLFGVLGRDIASIPGFAYSAALTGQEGVWDYEKLDHFVNSPGRAVPGTKMGYAGVKDERDRMDVIFYLRSLTAGEPMALPAPLPPPAETPPAGDPAAPGATPAPGASGSPTAPGAPATPAASPTAGATTAPAPGATASPAPAPATTPANAPKPTPAAPATTPKPAPSPTTH